MFTPSKLGVEGVEKRAPCRSERLVMAGFPLIKLAFLAVKQAAKPVASRLKNFAKDHPSYRRGMVRIGRGLHWNELQLDRLAEGKARLARIPPGGQLKESEAVERAGDFVAEGFIYSVSATILGVEYVLSKRKEEKKAAEAERKEAANEARQWQELRRLNDEVSRLNAEVSRLTERRGWFSRG